MMEDSDLCLPKCVNLNNFPAKLWRLVNNPTCTAVCWDDSGEVVVIDKQLFETQIFTPGLMSSESSDSFRTTNFTSLIRQLNLYGFKKTESVGSDKSAGQGNGSYCFKNPYFKRDHPELIRRVIRLTLERRAKLRASLEESGAHARRLTPPPIEDHQEAHSHSAGLSGTPIPPRYLIRGFNGPFLPDVRQPDKEMSLYLQAQYSGVASASSNVPFPQALMSNQGAAHYPSFNPCNASFYQPGVFPPVCYCYHPYGFGPPGGFIPPQGFYQGGYPGPGPYRGEPGPLLHSRETQQLIKYDVNLETVFQIADKVMQTPPSNQPVKVEGLEAAAASSPRSSTETRTGRGRARRSTSRAAGDVMAENNQQEESVASIPQDTHGKKDPETPELLDDSVIYVGSSQK